MDGSIKELAKYRFEKACEDLEVAKMNHNNFMYKASINRSYYAIFHAMRAVTILRGYDSSKHSGIIAFFNQSFVKAATFEKRISKIIASASKLREKSDYVDFYIASRHESEEQIEKAKEFLLVIEEYLVDNKII